MGTSVGGEPEPIREFRQQGWFNVWGVMLAVLIGLLCACLYWILRLGFRGALDNIHFEYEAFFAGVLAIVLVGRWSIPYLLLKAPTIDPRNARLMYMPRIRWFFKRAVDRTPPPGESKADR